MCTAVSNCLMSMCRLDLYFFNELSEMPLLKRFSVVIDSSGTNPGVPKGNPCKDPNIVFSHHLWIQNATPERERNLHLKAFNVVRCKYLKACYRKKPCDGPRETQSRELQRNRLPQPYLQYTKQPFTLTSLQLRTQVPGRLKWCKVLGDKHLVWLQMEKVVTLMYPPGNVGLQLSHVAYFQNVFYYWKQILFSNFQP